MTIGRRFLGVSVAGVVAVAASTSVLAGGPDGTLDLSFRWAEVRAIEASMAMPAPLLDEMDRTRLAERAAAVRAAMAGTVCREDVLRRKYRSGGRPGRAGGASFDLRITAGETGPGHERSTVDSWRRGERAAAEDAARHPSAQDWWLLFDQRNLGLMTIWDVGEHQDGFRRVRTLRFRGGLPFLAGRDVREWQGEAIVDAFSLELLSIRAWPNGQRARSDRGWIRFKKGLHLGLFGIPIHFRKRPVVSTLEVEFGPHEALGTVPVAVRHDRLRRYRDEQYRPVDSVEWRYEGYPDAGR